MYPKPGYEVKRKRNYQIFLILKEKKEVFKNASQFKNRRFLDFYTKNTHISYMYFVEKFLKK
jgi:hypothetical protein